MRNTSLCTYQCTCKQNFVNNLYFFIFFLALEDVKLQKECRQLKEKMAQMRSDQLSFQAEIKRVSKQQCIISVE